ncbi:hypothetical protein TVAG_527490 [Trichomonas vaginalis G3]|uniref:Uncharacterized protein n=1 Tax=Trichomonas vaginalis (strain ATCC PRA-98 / G3) TaxID=412133 RepID=A2GP66_TRIV3|nr:hypothetical protein TVAGG3_0496000 [Trichomonas vaginalis G3]EAX81051.1 hypothetical protein TVAG_527490 [Trichomonas vaginalis G3]KAI5516721.1 hypothetical protein TVAGG3_0496000 [Trichomonas vaginalis G3]|eukprot:XP_001293981.1 hypothetical protein [Trichomonas vaginalis G3]
MDLVTPPKEKQKTSKSPVSAPRADVKASPLQSSEIDSLIKNFRTPVKAFRPKANALSKSPTYYWKTKFQEEFRRGDFEAEESDLKNLELESWVPIYKGDIEKYQKQKNEKKLKDPLLNYTNPATVQEIEKQALRMITNAYREKMADAIPTLLQNQKILANKIAEKQKVSDQQIQNDKKVKERMIQTILLLQEDLDAAIQSNKRLANNIDLLKKAKTQAQLSKNGLKANVSVGLI